MALIFITLVSNLIRLSKCLIPEKANSNNQKKNRIFKNKSIISVKLILFSSQVRNFYKDKYVYLLLTRPRSNTKKTRNKITFIHILYVYFFERQPHKILLVP